MKFSFPRFLFGIILLLFITVVNAQQLEYNIVWFGKIGKLHINKIEKDAYAHIEIKSVVKIPFVNFNWITSMESQDGKLKSANYTQLIKGKKREFTDIINLNDTSWQLVNDSGAFRKFKISNTFYSSRLYFEEPVNLDYVFSERFGKSLKIVGLGNGKYRLLLPEDNHCEFYYENGICKEVKAKNGSRTIKMILIEESEN